MNLMQAPKLLVQKVQQTRSDLPIFRSTVGSIPAMMRLYSLGYADSLFIRPWTRLSLLHVLQETEPSIKLSSNTQAQEIFLAVQRELAAETGNRRGPRSFLGGAETVYTRGEGVGGVTLRDSYHLGQTVVNDYGRPYQSGLNFFSGGAAMAEYGRLSLYIRGEYQHSPSGTGYAAGLANQLSELDLNQSFTGPNAPQATIPAGPIVSQNSFRLIEASLPLHVLGHEISGGKSDAWLGPGRGGSTAWSNNAENIYSFRIDRVEPLSIPLVSRVLGPLRYGFMYGSLKGHTDPNSPYVHNEIFSFRPTNNFEFAFI